jgi:hypothetical protein
MVVNLILIKSIRLNHSVHSPPLSLRNSPHNFILHSYISIKDMSHNLPHILYRNVHYSNGDYDIHV